MNYTQLKDSVARWMARDDLTTEVAELIELAEAELNRELNPVETETTLTGTVGSRTIDLLALQVDEPIALFLSETGLDERELTQKAPGSFPIDATNGRPRYWSRDQRTSTDTIAFDRALDGAYPFRFRFAQKFALSSSAPTNWLLTNHPDVYLKAVLVWNGAYVRDAELQSREEGRLGRALRGVKNHIARSKKGLLTVDPALQQIGRGYGVQDLDEPL